MVDFIPNVMPWIWTGILVICIVIECFTFSLTTIWAALASVPLIFISRTSLSLQVQILIFAVITVKSAVFTLKFAVFTLKFAVIYPGGNIFYLFWCWIWIY